jgi:coniferyl-aldehyde dehydrogenase
MLKLSELTPRTSTLLERLIRQRFSENEFVTGGPTSACLLAPSLRSSFTGSTAVSHKIALAAAANLTPVTLEREGSRRP